MQRFPGLPLIGRRTRVPEVEPSTSRPALSHLLGGISVIFTGSYPGNTAAPPPTLLGWKHGGITAIGSTGCSAVVCTHPQRAVYRGSSLPRRGRLFLLPSSSLVLEETLKASCPSGVCPAMLQRNMEASAVGNDNVLAMSPWIPEYLLLLVVACPSTYRYLAISIMILSACKTMWRSLLLCDVSTACSSAAYSCRYEGFYIGPAHDQGRPLTQSS